MGKHVNKRFLNKEKIEAVESIQSGAETVEQVTERLGTSRGLIHKWIYQHDQGLFRGREYLTTVKIPKTPIRKVLAPQVQASVQAVKYGTPPVTKFEVTEHDWKVLKRKVKDLEAAFGLLFSKRV